MKNAQERKKEIDKEIDRVTEANNYETSHKVIKMKEPESIKDPADQAELKKIQGKLFGKKTSKEIKSQFEKKIREGIQNAPGAKDSTRPLIDGSSPLAKDINFRVDIKPQALEFQTLGNSSKTLLYISFPENGLSERQVTYIYNKITETFKKIEVSSVIEFTINQSGTKRKGFNSFQEGSMIDISLPVYEYTMSGITKILALRNRIQVLARTGNVGILPNYYSFRKEDNNIFQIFFELRQRTEKHVLVPLSLYDKHAVGIMFVAQDDGSGYKAFYLDPENTVIPEGLATIFKDNGCEIEQLPTEGQRYTNCGPEVIENFMLYLTGERLSQEDAIVNNSRLVEQELLSSSYDAEEASCLTLKDSYSKQDAVTVISNAVYNTQVSSDDYIIDNPTRYDIVTPQTIIDGVVVRADLGREPSDVLLELVHDYRINQDYTETILGEVTSIDIS